MNGIEVRPSNGSESATIHGNHIVRMGEHGHEVWCGPEKGWVPYPKIVMPETSDGGYDWSHTPGPVYCGASTASPETAQSVMRAVFERRADLMKRLS